MDGTFTTVAAPDPFYSPKGINDSGQIVGNIERGLQRGFVYSDGVFTTIDFPGALQTQALAINAAGEVFGEYETDDGHTHPFLYQAGVFAPAGVPVSFGYANARS